MGTGHRFAGDCIKDVLVGDAPDWEDSFGAENPNCSPSILLAGDFMASLKGAGGGRRTGLPKITVGSVGGGDVVASSVGNTSSSVSTGGFMITGGFMGLLWKSLNGVPSMASSSSDSTSCSLFNNICVTFLGPRGIGALPSISSVSSVSSLVFFLVAMDLVVDDWGARFVEVGFRTGFARMPAAAGSTTLVAGVFAFESVSGRTFSLSGSANVTVFLTGLEVGAPLDLVDPTGRPRGLLTGSGATSSTPSSWSTFALLARVRVDSSAASPFTGAVAGFFGGRPRGRGAAGAVVGAERGLGSMIFLGRPGPRIARWAGPEVAGGSLARASVSRSSSWSSGRVLRLVDVLVAEVATVEELEAGPATVRVFFVLVTIVANFRAAEDAVPAVALEVFTAALDLVTRLGGSAGETILAKCWSCVVWWIVKLS